VQKPCSLSRRAVRASCLVVCVVAGQRKPRPLLFFFASLMPGLAESFTFHHNIIPLTLCNNQAAFFLPLITSFAFTASGSLSDAFGSTTTSLTNATRQHPAGPLSKLQAVQTLVSTPSSGTSAHLSCQPPSACASFSAATLNSASPTIFFLYTSAHTVASNLFDSAHDCLNTPRSRGCHRSLGVSQKVLRLPAASWATIELASSRRCTSNPDTMPSPGHPAQSPDNTMNLAL
jgi:hypothetical protein